MIPVAKPSRREDILVSICIGDLSIDALDFDAVREFVREIDANYRFREIVLVARAEQREAFLELVRDVANLRLFIVRDGLSIYQERVVAASEAIGDVVLIAGSATVTASDAVAMIEQATDEACIVVAQQSAPRGINRIVSLVLSAAGRAAGFRAGFLDSPIIAAPRTLLNKLLNHSDPDLALRFVPRDPAIPSARYAVRAISARARTNQGFGRRIGLIHKLVVHMAPRILMVVALASALLTVFGLAFALYVIGVWIVKASVAPGWLTISAMLSATATFLGTTIFGLSVGLQRLLALLRGESIDSVAQEVNRIDLFGQMACELNVDLDRSHG